MIVAICQGGNHKIFKQIIKIAKNVKKSYHLVLLDFVL